MLFHATAEWSAQLVKISFMSHEKSVV